MLRTVARRRLTLIRRYSNRDAGYPIFWRVWQAASSAWTARDLSGAEASFTGSGGA